MSLHLPPRLCFGLVGLVLVGVLAMGNPCRSCLKASGTTIPAALQVAAPEVPAAMAPSAPDAAEPCPIPEFAHVVVAVRRDDHGEPFWVLNDGRMIKRAVDALVGQPRYVVLRPNADAAQKTRLSATR